MEWWVDGCFRILPNVRAGIKSWNDEKTGNGWIDWVATMALGYREAPQTLPRDEFVKLNIFFPLACNTKLFCVGGFTANQAW